MFSRPIVALKVLLNAHSTILSTCTKPPPVIKTCVCLFLSGRLRQVSLYKQMKNTFREASNMFKTRKIQTFTEYIL